MSSIIIIKMEKAIAERHLTDHNKPHKHSDPHDHLVDWDKNFPDMSSPINHTDSIIPTFEEFAVSFLEKYQIYYRR